MFTQRFHLSLCHSITCRYYAAPTIHHAIIASRPDSTTSLKEIRIRMICNGAGELVPSLASRMKEIFTGVVILPSYGMTELVSISPQIYSCLL